MILFPCRKSALLVNIIESVISSFPLCEPNTNKQICNTVINGVDITSLIAPHNPCRNQVPQRFVQLRPSICKHFVHFPAMLSQCHDYRELELNLTTATGCDRTDKGIRGSYLIRRRGSLPFRIACKMRRARRGLPANVPLKYVSFALTSAYVIPVGMGNLGY